MRRFFPILLALSLAGLAALAIPRTRAEDVPPAQELHELRQAVDQQSKQIEILTEQITRLTHALQNQKAAEPPAPAAPTTSIEGLKFEGLKPAPELAPAPSPSVAPAAAPEAPKADAVPKAEPAVSGPKHTVAKGETLTSIAKHYNIPIADLKNANKIENERKLQIGQILTVPTAKTPETPDTKKDNP